MIFPKSTGVVESLRAFAKLYGYVRFFHPSDEASEVDWDRFAVYGAGQAKRAKDTRELKQILERLFLPLAPTLQLFDDDHPPLPPWFPEKRAGLDVVAWRHRGVGGLTALPTTYVSLRSNRSSSSAAAARAVRQWVDARPYACRKVRLSACARTSSTHPHDLSGLWLSAVATYAGLFPLPSWNLVFVPIRSGDWRRYEAEALLPPGTVRLAFGAYPAGAGTLWVDDFELAVQDTTGDWRPIQVRDAGFEEDVPLEQSDCWEWLEREFEYVRTA